MTDSTVAALRALHPKASEPVPVLPDEAPRIQVDTDVLMSLVRSGLQTVPHRLIPGGRVSFCFRYWMI